MSEVITLKEIINELKEISSCEKILSQEYDTYDYVVNQRVIMSNKLNQLFHASNLDKEDFLIMKNAFNVQTSLNEKPYTIDFFTDYD